MNPENQRYGPQQQTPPQQPAHQQRPHLAERRISGMPLRWLAVLLSLPVLLGAALLLLDATSETGYRTHGVGQAYEAAFSGGVALLCFSVAAGALVIALSRSRAAAAAAVAPSLLLLVTYGPWAWAPPESDVLISTPWVLSDSDIGLLFWTGPLAGSMVALAISVSIAVSRWRH